MCKKLKEVTKIKNKLKLVGLDHLLDNLVYIEEKPINGFDKSVVFEEINGVTIVNIIKS
jgi:hypothetical protein